MRFFIVILLTAAIFLNQSPRLWADCPEGCWGDPNGAHNVVNFIVGLCHFSDIRKVNFDGQCNISSNDAAINYDWWALIMYPEYCNVDTVSCLPVFSTDDTVFVGCPPYHVFPGGDSINIPIMASHARSLRGFQLGFERLTPGFRITSAEIMCTDTSWLVNAGAYSIRTDITGAVDTFSVCWVSDFFTPRPPKSRDTLVNLHVRLEGTLPSDKVVISPIFVPPTCEPLFSHDYFYNYSADERPNFQGCCEEEFLPERDGWSFEDNQTNMWPKSWWQQFDYSASPYAPCSACRWKGAPGFSCFAQSSDFPDWPLFVSAFGPGTKDIASPGRYSDLDTQFVGTAMCYFDPPPGKVIFRQSAIEYWKAIKGSWTGSDLGFAVSSLLFSNGFLDVAAAFPGSAELYDVALSDSSRKLINKYQISQYGSQQLASDSAGRKNARPRSTFQETVDMLGDCVDRFQIINENYFNYQSNGGRALVPFEWRRDPYDEYHKFYVGVYDPRWPGSHGLFTPEVYYYFPFTTADPCMMWDWGYQNRYIPYCLGYTYLQDVSEYALPPLIPVSNSSLKLARAPLQPADANGIVLYYSMADSVLIMSSEGSIGHGSSGMFNSLNGAWEITTIADDSLSQPPIGCLLPKQQFDISASGVRDSAFSLSIFADSVVFVYARENVDSSDVENISYQHDANKLVVRNPSPSPRTYQFRSVSVSPDSEVSWTISRIDASANDSADFALAGGAALRIDNFGGTDTVSLTGDISSASHQSVFYCDSIPLISNSSFILSPNWGQHGDSLLILIDEGMTGSFADSLKVANEPAPYICGDANADATVDISDAVYLISYIFSGGSAPEPLEAGDANCDQGIDISDAVYLISYIFSGGLAPCAGCK